MAHLYFGESVDIDASPEAILAVMVDIERWPEWTPTVSRIERLDPGPLVVGSRARIRQPGLPPAVWTVTSIEPGRSFTWVAKGPPGIVVTAHHTIERRDGGSRVTLALKYDGLFAGMLGWATRGINERYLAMEANGLKARCESRPEV